MRLQQQRPRAGWLTSRWRAGGARAGALPAWACLRCMVDDACQCVSTLAHWHRYVCLLCSVLVHAYGARVFGKWGTGSRCPRVRQGGERERLHAHAITTHTDWHTHTRLTRTDRQARHGPWRIPRSSSSSLSVTVCALQHTYTSGWPHRPHPFHWHTLSRSHSAHHLDVLGHSFPLSPCVCPLALRPAIMGLLSHRPKYALTHTHTHTKRTPGPYHRLAHTQQTRTQRSKRT
jgi:hypothetical protein